MWTSARVQICSLPSAEDSSSFRSISPDIGTSDGVATPKFASPLFHSASFCHRQRPSLGSPYLVRMDHFSHTDISHVALTIPNRDGGESSDREDSAYNSLMSDWNFIPRYFLLPFSGRFRQQWCRRVYSSFHFFTIIGAVVLSWHDEVSYLWTTTKYTYYVSFLKNKFWIKGFGTLEVICRSDRRYGIVTDRTIQYCDCFLTSSSSNIKHFS